MCIVFVFGLPINIITLIGWRGFRGKLLGFRFIENVTVILKVDQTTQKDLLIAIWWSWRMFLIFSGWSLVSNYLMDFPPDSFSSLIHKSSLNTSRLLHLSARTSSYFNSLFVALPRLWNGIPSELRESPNLASFKTGCRSFYIDLYT